MTPRYLDDTGGLTPEQRAELLDLDPRLFGPWIFLPERSSFRSEEHKRASWLANVGTLTEGCARRWPGQRPHAWWRWSAPPDAPSWRQVVEQPPDVRHQEVQAQYLRSKGLLFEHESKALRGE